MYVTTRGDSRAKRARGTAKGKCKKSYEMAENVIVGEMGGNYIDGSEEVLAGGKWHAGTRMR